METQKGNNENEKIIIQISDLKNEIMKEIKNIGNAKNNVFEHLKTKSLESKLQRLNIIEEILGIDKYKIAFIGRIGVGKTTAICHLFNLVGEFIRQEQINKKTITVKKTESLCSAKSGRTTISEVIIKPSDKTYIEIEPYSREELENSINRFCESLYKTDSEGNSDSAELERAIRSIINLKKTTIKDKSTDLAKEAALKMPVEQLKVLSLKNANLDKRIFRQEDSRLICPDGKEERTWLKEKFDNVNYGEEKTFSIPHKIYVYVSSKLLRESQLSSFDSVIDTKGIDEEGSAIRTDLRDYIEREDSICLFTTSYNDAPEANIRELFKYFLSQRTKRFEHRFVILVLPHKGEPEKENDGDNTWETGVSIKKDVIIDALRKINLKFIPDNILFFDALKYYDERYRLMPDYTGQDTQENKNDIIFWLNYIIEKRKEFLNTEVQEIKDSFLTIISGQALSASDITVINSTVDEIKRLSDLNLRIQGFIYEEFINKYIDFYASHYPAWNTKDAIHRRFGTYAERGFNTYEDAKVVSEGTDADEMIKKFTKGIKDEIINTIKKLGDTHPDLNTFTPEIIKRFEIAYDNFIARVGDSIQQYFRQHNENIEFWSDLINRRGKGKGYNDDVCTLLRRNLDSISNGHGNYVSANRILQEFTEKHWREAIEQVLNFFVSS